MLDFFGDIISVGFSLLRFTFLKLFHYATFRFHWVERFSPNVSVKLGKKAGLVLGRRISVHSGSKIVSTAEGILEIGDNCGINRNCVIICRHRIKIGSGVIFGPSVLIYDHDHDYRAEGGIRAGKYKCDAVTIGKNCWIGANTIILRGTQIGDNCIIGAGSVVKGIVPDNTVFVQKRVNEFKSYGIQGE